MDLLDRLLEHDRWTTERILAICHSLPPQALTTPFAIGPGTLDATLRHMIGNLQVWTDLLNERPVSPPDAVQNATLDGLVTLSNALYKDFALVARRLQASGCLDACCMDTLDDPPTAKSNGGMIAHVLTHNMHHRCELLQMLGQLGVPALIEGDVLSWEARPPTTAPALAPVHVPAQP